jgi:competence protein ComFB
MYELKNYTETVVYQALQEYIQKNPISCTCERCQADIMAMALNRLPPKYYVSLKGEILTQWESIALPDRVRVMADVVRAAQQVSSSPSHSLEEE